MFTYTGAARFILEVSMGARAYRNEFTIEPQREPTIASLLRQLVSDIIDLVRNEFALARSEFSDATKAARTGIISAAVAAVILTVGALTLTAALVLALAQWMNAWLAAVIVGGTLTVLGIVLLARAKRQLDPGGLTLRRTRESIGTDVEVVTRRNA